jgi:RimJ/RimL family protein N-acetyltransferase
MRSSAPSLSTERLVLRGFRRDDLGAHASMLAEPSVMQHIGGKPLSREDAWRRMLAAVGSWTMLGMGLWAIELRSTGRVVGHCGFFDFERDMVPSICGEPEMGWIFDPSVHGQGVAFEACIAALGWAELNLRSPSYPAIISPENQASEKLASRLGFEKQCDALYEGQITSLFRRPAVVRRAS